MRPQVAFLLGVGAAGALWALTSWWGGGSSPASTDAVGQAATESPAAGDTAPHPREASGPVREETPPASAAARRPKGGEEEERATSREGASPEGDRPPVTAEAVLERLTPATVAQMKQVHPDLPKLFSSIMEDIGVWVDDASLQRMALRYAEIKGGEFRHHRGWMKRGLEIEDEEERKAWEKEGIDRYTQAVHDLYASFLPYVPRDALDRAFRKLFPMTEGPWSESGP